MSTFALVGLVTVSTISFLIIRKSNPEIAVVIPIAASAMIFSMCYEWISDIREYSNQAESAEFGEYITVLIKACGIIITGKIAENICGNEKLLAYATDMFVKFYIISLSIPLIEKIYELLCEALKL